MGRITQTTKVTKRVQKVPKGYHKCPNCGGDGVCKTIAQSKRKN